MTELSPEALAPRLGVSRMTLRRWQKESGRAQLPAGYLPQIAETVYELLAEGRLNHQAAPVRSLVQGFQPKSFAAAMQSLDISPTTLPNGDIQDQTTFAIAQIGYGPEHRSEVERSESKIRAFESFGAEWKKMIGALWSVVSSGEIQLVDKMVAYGALFYLIFPFDLIPDSIPVVGYVDDFGILSVAAAHYASRIPKSKPAGKSSAQKRK